MSIEKFNREWVTRTPIDWQKYRKTEISCAWKNHYFVKKVGGPWPPSPPNFFQFFKYVLKISFLKDLYYMISFDILTQSSHQGCSVKNVFFEISQNSQENTCARVYFLITPATLLKGFWHRFFPVNFVKFLRTPCLQNTSGRLQSTQAISWRQVCPIFSIFQLLLRIWKPRRRKRKYKN